MNTKKAYGSRKMTFAKKLHHPIVRICSGITFEKLDISDYGIKLQDVQKVSDC